MKRIEKKSVVLAVVTAGSLFWSMVGRISPAQAQNAGDAVSELQDLVDVRGRDGEAVLQERGYEYRWAETSDDAVYSYWTQPETGQCITVQMAAIRTSFT